MTASEGPPTERMLAFVAVLAQVVAPAADPCRRPHCTLGGEDLPYLLALADVRTTKHRGTLRLPDGSEVDAWWAWHALIERHRFGHGGMPKPQWSGTWTEFGSVACDPLGLAAAIEVAQNSRAAGSPLAIEVVCFARLAELSGDSATAERVLIDATQSGPGLGAEYQFEYLAQFLARRGRFAEALPLFERSPILASCGLNAASQRSERAAWIERCIAALQGDACREELWVERRFEIGAQGLARHVATALRAAGSGLPVEEALEWFDRALAPKLAPLRVGIERADFVTELTQWNQPRPRAIDAHDPEEVARVVDRIRELMKQDEYRAATLLLEACDTGLPVVGAVVLEFAGEASTHWHTSLREEFRERWREAILLRTYGCADPLDPETW